MSIAVVISNAIVFIIISTMDNLHYITIVMSTKMNNTSKECKCPSGFMWLRLIIQVAIFEKRILFKWLYLKSAYYLSGYIWITHII